MKFFIYVLLIIAILTIWYHNVSKKLTSEDSKYVEYFLMGIDTTQDANQLTYSKQIEIIKKIQENVLDIAPLGKGMAKNKDRGVKNLYEYGKGKCYDRSYVIELLLQKIGFKTRHVSLYKDYPEDNILSELSSISIPSHAISEVKTKKGWLIVDSNFKWIGLDRQNMPISMKMINDNKKPIIWKADPPSFFYNEHSHYIYGLYSRHGGFYKPFNRIPDYNLRELFYNF